ncbi:MAG: hypothetical protein CVT69_00565 [Actinobacteria bacterium HGW-Actinobacteria-9]|nr:MAG: hypothetical protein CVT69_00565 [Actinobacteria bacterium HGW-Actinobacteria-9]
MVDIAAVAGVGWLASLPLLGIGMGCFWLQRDSNGAASFTLGIAAVLGIASALVLPGLVPWVLDRRHASFVTTVARSVGIALVSLAAASLLSVVEALRPEDISFFGHEFAAAHALAAAVPTAAALGLLAAAFWRRGPDRRLVWIAPGVIVAILGVVAWWWSAGTGYHAIRFTNADEIILMAQTVALGSLLFVSIGSAVVSPSHMERAAARFAA